MKEIPLISRRGEVVGSTVVDDSDFELVSRYTWRLLKQPHNSYARTTTNGERVYLHRFLFPEADEVDHINHNGLDNQRSNLRPSTHQQNMFNQAPRGEWKGVTQRSPTLWRAAIQVYDSWFHLGNFPTPEAAARAYDEIAYAAWGDRAWLNFPDRIEEYRWQARISCYYPDGTPVVPNP